MTSKFLKWQLTDFNSETEGKSNGSICVDSKSTQTESEDETKVFFNHQINNNASVLKNTLIPDPSDEEDLEEGECSQISNHSSPTREQPTGKGEDLPGGVELIDQRISSKFKEYFDERMGNWSRVMQLEKELAENKRYLEELKAKGKDINGDSQSELMIYTKAVKKKRDSSSSEENDDVIDTSDELMTALDVVEKQMVINQEQRSGSETLLRPGTSRGVNGEDQMVDGRDSRVIVECSVPEQKADRAVQEAEAARVRVTEVKGTEIENRIKQIRLESGSGLGRVVANVNTAFTKVVDDNYMLVAMHVDETTRDKILNNEYVDFSRLLRHDKPYSQDEDQQKMMTVNKGG